MKALLLFTMTIISFQSFAYTLSDFAGKYQVTAEQVPATNIITMDTKGNITLVETSQYGNLDCSGSSTLTDNTISSQMVCKNGSSFEQKINIAKVKSLKSFSAPVYSTLFGQEIVMKFKKIK